MASEDVQTNLRLPADLKNLLVMAAEASNRSLSAEVASRLEESFKVTHAMDLVLDQAQQIKELRGMVMEANITMSQALQVLKGVDDDRDGAVESLLETIRDTSGIANLHLKKMVNAHMLRSGETAEEFMKNLQSELEKSRAKKPKP